MRSLFFSSPPSTVSARTLSPLARMCAQETAMAASAPRVIHRMRTFLGPSVWLEFTPLAKLTKSVNLGQGFPGWAPPQFVKDALARASLDDRNMQYAHPAGVAELRSAIADTYSERLGFNVDLNKHIVVTVGASQALSLACHALLQEGDEVVLIEPAFDIYTGATHMAGATPVYVPMRAKSESGQAISTARELYIDMDELAAALTPRTRMLILNSPHNPTGKVFSREELTAISELIDEKCPQCLVMSDEVYEHLVFGADEHVPFASISPSARSRTLSVYSAGKTFSSTGLKIGWIISENEPVMRQLRIAQQYIVFCISHVPQVAVAESLRMANKPYEGHSSYYKWLCEYYCEKRDMLHTTLTQVGMQPIAPDGAFYILAKVPEDGTLGKIAHAGFPAELEKMVNNGEIQIDPSTRNSKDYNICRNLTIHKGVACIPPSAFFCEAHRNGNPLAEQYVRFAFCKPDDQLDEANRRLI